MSKRASSFFVMVILALLAWHFFIQSKPELTAIQEEKASSPRISSVDMATTNSANGKSREAENQLTVGPTVAGDCYTSSAIPEKMKKIDIARNAMMLLPNVPKANREVYSTYSINNLKILAEQGNVYAMFELAHIYSAEYSRRRFSPTSQPMRDDIDLTNLEALQSTSRQLFIRAAENGLNEAVSDILYVLPSCRTCDLEDPSVKEKYLEYLKWEILDKSRGITVISAEPTDHPQPRWVFPNDFERVRSTEVKEALIAELEALLKDLNSKRKAKNVAPYILGREILDHAGVSLILNTRCDLAEH